MPPRCKRFAKVHQFVGRKLTHACYRARLCAGITSASPLFRNNVGPGSKVGVVGLGGLGHYAVLFAIALGAEVTVRTALI